MIDFQFEFKKMRIIYREFPILFIENFAQFFKWDEKQQKIKEDANTKTISSKSNKRISQNSENINK